LKGITELIMKESVKKIERELCKLPLFKNLKGSCAVSFIDSSAKPFKRRALQEVSQFDLVIEMNNQDIYKGVTKIKKNPDSYKEKAQAALRRVSDNFKSLEVMDVSVQQEESGMANLETEKPQGISMVMIIAISAGAVGLLITMAAVCFFCKAKEVKRDNVLEMGSTSTIHVHDASPFPHDPYRTPEGKHAPPSKSAPFEDSTPWGETPGFPAGNKQGLSRDEGIHSSVPATEGGSRIPSDEADISPEGQPSSLTKIPSEVKRFPTSN